MQLNNVMEISLFTRGSVKGNSYHIFQKESFILLHTTKLIIYNFSFKTSTPKQKNIY